MQYKLLASDYDNTLVPFGEHFPRPAVVKAVKKMQAAGGKFVLSTGRAWSAVNRKGQLGVPACWTGRAASLRSTP